MNRSHPRFHTRTLLVPYLQNFSRAGRFVPNEAHRSGYRSSRDAFNYMIKSLQPHNIPVHGPTLTGG